MRPKTSLRQTSLPDEFGGQRRHRPDMPMLLCIITLILLGLIVIYAISPALIARLSDSTEISQNYFLYRQLIYIGLGLGAFTLATAIPLGWWRKNSAKLLLIGLVLSTLPFILQATPLALCVNGACRWIDLGPISFQPVEILKLTLLVFIAGFIATRASQGTLHNAQQTFVPVGVLLLVVAGIVIGLQKDLGTGLTVFSIAITMLFIAGIRARTFAVILAGTAAVGVIFILAAPHRVERILTFVNHSSSTSEDMGYHVNQALIAIGSGGLTGKGLGQSIQAFGYLPEAANDSIFAILAEKFGFLGTVAVLGIFAALFMRLLRVIAQTMSLFPRLIVAGTFGWVFSHSIINIGAMLGIFPLTGITLPFVSFGGTSLVCMLAALGLVFQISRYSTHTTTVRSEGGSNDDFGSRRRVGRSRDASVGSS
ncbi:MAG TPA: putative peptidoglycan glycosyltransferase FtsW [Candidatus Saccharimonadales bacterium]|nr:putative peptidoglycan glycosyltransferase FtsW [Candidatus Saccharimonadales bacterium]